LSVEGDDQISLGVLIGAKFDKQFILFSR